MAIKAYSYPRAALIGNPSDGYYGKTIAFVFSNFRAEVRLEESDRLEIIPGNQDKLDYDNIDSLVNDINIYGYYGGIRLLKASCKRFYEYCKQEGIGLDQKNFKVSYCSDIPNRLGLAGSSAIITAFMKALMQFYGVEIKKPQLANLVLSVEVEELGISAGLQDRVAQVYEQPVYMDFDKRLMDARGYGEYVPFNADRLPHIYIAYLTHLSEGSEVSHNDFKKRYLKGDEKVLEAIEEWRVLSETVYTRLLADEELTIDDLLNANFDIRQKVMNIHPDNLKMVEMARSCGASAKFTGSGGAIIGTYKNEEVFKQLQAELANIGAVVIKPQIVNNG